MFRDQGWSAVVTQRQQTLADWAEASRRDCKALLGIMAALVKVHTNGLLSYTCFPTLCPVFRCYAMSCLLSRSLFMVFRGKPGGCTCVCWEGCGLRAAWNTPALFVSRRSTCGHAWLHA
jgi:hypothetical protein